MSSALLWFRRDLRLHDHAALFHACRAHQRVYCVFVFDTDILQALPRADRRVEFIHGSIVQLAAALEEAGGQLLVKIGSAQEEIPRLAQELGVDTVWTNHDYEPQAIARDAAVAQALQAQGRALRTCKDQVIYERNEILTQGGQAFSVFTPYKNAWLKRMHSEGGAATLPVYAANLAHLAHHNPGPIPSLQELGFEKTNLLELGIQPGMDGAAALVEEFAGRIGAYGERRDFPGIKGPSYLSVHLRFGTVSIRSLVRMAAQVIQAEPAASNGAQVWLNELIWREFYQMILYHYPHVVQSAFKPAYDAITWRSGAQAEQDFAAWCAGETGYPLVDAAMRQLLHTGYMHNRLRMVSACFLIKDLGLDWRWGEQFFALHLNDFDLSANNGGWQWAASSGCDAQPWFRIFNPITQSEKFDAQGKFICRYLPQLAPLAKIDPALVHAPWLAKPDLLRQAGLRLGEHYPWPLVDHKSAREETLKRYAVVKTSQTDQEN